MVLMLPVVKRQQTDLRKIVVGDGRSAAGKHRRTASVGGIRKVLRQVRHIDGISVVETHIRVMRSVVLSHIVAAAGSNLKAAKAKTPRVGTKAIADSSTVIVAITRTVMNMISINSRRKRGEVAMTC